jgi:hypothetical protein
MIKQISKIRKALALLLLVVFLSSFWTENAYGFPGGPVQPEYTSFNPISNTGMVDNFTGTFKYNIPLMDVGGYPINLIYDGNVSAEQEASWVGLGWNLNTGSIVRNKRGMPDDFHGDVIRRYVDQKPIRQYGGTIGANAQILNFLGLTASGGVYYKTNSGWGTEASFGKSISLGVPITGSMNLSLGYNDKITSSSSGGVTYSQNTSLSLATAFGGERTKCGLSLGLSYGESSNSRQGQLYKSFSAGLSAGMLLSNYNMTNQEAMKYMKHGRAAGIGRTINFIDPTYLPTVEIPTENSAFTGSLTGGGTIFFIDAGVILTGYGMVQSIVQNDLSHKSFGYFNSQFGLSDPSALLDFNREKDVPYHPKVPNISIPNYTYDLFQINQHDGGGQFRAFRNDVGILRDPYTKTTDNSTNVSLEGHFGNIFEAGANIEIAKVSTETGESKEASLKNFDFQTTDYKINPIKESIVLKKTEDIEQADESYFQKINGYKATNVGLIGDAGDRDNRLESDGSSYKNDNTLENFSTELNTKYSGKFLRPNLRNTYISYLNMENRMKYGFEPKVDSFSNIGTEKYNKSGEVPMNNYSKNLISSIKVTNNDGTIYNYGIPVMSKKQVDYSFSIGSPNILNRTTSPNEHTGLAIYPGSSISRTAKLGRDHFYSEETTPAYAHSWLVTSILSPDYVDVMNDGITDDDRGTAIKFNYSKSKQDYSWRNPLNPNLQTNPSQLAVTHYKGIEYLDNDDKGSITYGEREEWYNHTIESKTMIAYFFTTPRNDAQPLTIEGKIDASKAKKEKLDYIKLYSKAELARIIQGNQNISRQDLLNRATPIKTINFIYETDNSKMLCGHMPNNSVSGAGKLTLKEVRITNGTNTSPISYKFNYGNKSEDNPKYSTRETDRWGNFKSEGANNQFAPGQSLNNDQFPYTIQDKVLADKNAQAWLLKEINLPSGGTIKVDYESHDYSYIQNKRTAQMFKVVGFGSSPNDNLGKDDLYNGFDGNNYLFFETNLPAGTYTKTEISKLFFEDKNDYEHKKYLYYKLKVRLDGSKYEYMPGYEEILDFDRSIRTSNGKLVIWVKIKPYVYQGKDLSPIARNSWQFIRDNLPELAWDGYSVGENPDFMDVIGSLVANIGKIVAGEDHFENQATSRGLAKKVLLNGNSWIRAYCPQQTKYGGTGSRVKRISVIDNWDAMVKANETNALQNETAEYTIDYEYTKKNSKKEDISSGVATYEPLIGGDENPWRQPVFYEGQIAPGGIHSMYSVEKPFGETMFPSPSIGYSKVKVTSNKLKSQQFNTGNGFNVYKYYTAFDFPLKTENTILNAQTAKRDNPDWDWDILSFFNNHHDRMSVTQGYSLTLNNMHGKPITDEFFKYGQLETDNPKSYTKYYYKNTTKIPVIDESGQIVERNMGVQTDFYMDNRFQISKTNSTTFSPGGGMTIVPIPMIPGFLILGYGTAFAYHNSDEKSIKMISTNKVTNLSYVQDKTEVNNDGATVTTENLLWDRKTGEVVVSKLNNEFNKTLYNFNMPAYWAYKNLGHTYQYSDYSIQMKTNSPADDLSIETFNQKNGNVMNKVNYLNEGDEVYLEDVTSTPVGLGKFFYTPNVKVPIPYFPGQFESINFLVGYNGQAFMPTNNKTYKVTVIRSAIRNMQTAKAMSISSMEDPRNMNSIKSGVSNVLSGTAQLYSDKWKWIAKRHLEPNAGNMPMITPVRNPFVYGIIGNWRPQKSFSLLGNKSGHSYAGENPNLANDAINTDNPIGGGKLVNFFYIASGGKWIMNTNLSNWNTQSENTLFDAKGNLVEEFNRISKYGLCYDPALDPDIIPTSSPPQNAYPYEEPNNNEVHYFGQKIESKDESIESMRSIIKSKLDGKYLKREDVDLIIDNQIKNYNSRKKLSLGSNYTCVHNKNEHLSDANLILFEVQSILKTQNR